jgi:hypothetical protein
MRRKKSKIKSKPEYTGVPELPSQRKKGVLG